VKYKLEWYGDPWALIVTDPEGNDVAYLTLMPVRYGTHANPLEGCVTDDVAEEVLGWVVEQFNHQSKGLNG
jgi:hypothetical protein